MTASEIKTNLTSIANTLDQIQVTGHTNMNRLLGCYVLLNRIIPEIDNIDAGNPDNVTVDDIKVEMEE